MPPQGGSSLKHAHCMLCEDMIQSFCAATLADEENTVDIDIEDEVEVVQLDLVRLNIGFPRHTRTVCNDVCRCDLMLGRMH